MIHMMGEVEPRPPSPAVDPDRRTAVREIRTITAVVLSAWRHSNGRGAARLNAYVDGLGHRTLHVELTRDGYDQVVATLQRPGVLIRCSGMLVDQGPCPCWVPTERLQLLVPHEPG
jgi:hypothetical protein